MNVTTLFNFLSLILLLLTVGWLGLNRRAFIHTRWIKAPLIFALCSYAFINFSNIMEHSGHTSLFDPVEDIAEILFLVLFIFFLFGYRAYMYVREVMIREDWLDSAVNSLYEGLIATDEKGRIKFINSRMEEMTGLPREELQERTAGEVLLFLDKEAKRPLGYNPFDREEIESPGEKYPTGVYLKRQTGDPVLVLCHVSYVRSKEGRIFGMIGSFNDVGAHFSMMEQLNHLQKMEAIGQLASGVAHDLNNMLGGISGAAELLQNGVGKRGDKGAAELLEIIFYSVDNARELTTNLLSFGRKNKIISTGVELGEILSKSCDIARRAIDKIISIELTLPEGNIPVSGDPAQLQNAFLNLILNARDAQPEGGKIEIRAEEMVLNERECEDSKYRLIPGEYARVSVCDEGTGISPEIRDRIFEPFFTTKEKGKGTGLGLAAVHNTVENHNGAMKIENREGGGCCFTLYFPLNQNGMNAPYEEGERAGKSLKGRRILVVDDESIIRTTTTLMLEEAEVFCLPVESGSDCLKILKEGNEPFDAVILDLVMPEMGGREAAGIIHAMRPDLPLILMSGFNQKIEFPPHIKGFLKKPFRKKEILGLLADIL